MIRELRLAYFVSLLCRVLEVTTDSRHSLPVAENLPDQKFEASAPNQIWLIDIN